MPDSAASLFSSPEDGSFGAWCLSEDQARAWQEATGLGEQVAHAAGSLVLRQGAPSPYFFFMLQGRVQLNTWLADGAVFVVDVIGRKGLFGETAALAGLPCPCDALVLEDSEMLRFDARTLMSALSQHPALCGALMVALASRSHALTQRLSHWVHKRPQMRVGEMLHRMALLARTDGLVAADACATRPRDGQTKDRPPILIDTVLTHAQIAGMTGLTRVTVTRTLKRLSQRGAIDVVGRRIRVLDAARLLTEV